MKNEAYPFQAAVVRLKERISDAKVSEDLIAQGCRERIKAFWVFWKATGDDRVAEQEAIKRMLLKRGDLMSTWRKMHNPDRIFAYGEVNEAFVKLGELNLASLGNYLFSRRRPKRQLKRFWEISGVL